MALGLRTAWNSLVGPLLRRPNRFQVAALCHRGTGPDRRVLLITSRDTGRWILPKGWPIDGLSARGAAMQEAWEEAGVKEGEIADEPLGVYEYDKRMDSGGVATVETKVFDVAVTRLVEDYPESDERQRKWVTASEAATMVDEPELRHLLERF